MGRTTAIEWTDATWNPVTGCHKLSPGCKNCYAERIFNRPYPGRAFNDVRLHMDRLDQPVRWRDARMIFVCSMSDLFQEDVPTAFIRSVWAVMDKARRHTFQVLTKRPERMREFLRSIKEDDPLRRNGPWPYPNVWVGTSVENQPTANMRVPALLRTPAAVRFVSCEPLLAAVDLEDCWYPDPTPDRHDGPWKLHCNGLTGELATSPYTSENKGGIDWVIVGGESGPKARPMDLSWAHGIVAACKRCAVPVFVKQLGGWPNVHREMKDWPHYLRVQQYPEAPQ